MTLDDRALRDALRSGAGSSVATPEKWEAVVAGSRVARRRRVAQRFAVAGLSAAALIVAGVVLWVSGPSEDRRDLIDQPSGSGPVYIVVAEDGGIVVRDARDGKIVRMIVETAAATEDVSASPDGSYVYFTRYEEVDCGGGPGDVVTRSDVMRVPISGGEQEVFIPDASRGLISPTGNYIVYTPGWTCDGAIRHRLMRRTIGVPNSDTAIDSTDPSDPQALLPVAWSKDESFLLTEGTPPPSRERELFLIEGLPDDPRRTKVRYAKSEFDEVGPTAREGPGVVLGPRSLAGSVEFDGETWIASFDPKTGEVTERLFELPKRPEYLHVDASGQHFLASVDAERGYTVYRWSVGDDAPTKLEDVMVRDLAWARGPTKASEHYAAITPDGELQIRSTSDGNVVRTVADGIDVEHGSPELFITPDGRYAYVDGVAREGVCANETRAVERINLDTGEHESVVAEANGFSLSPNGSEAAYVFSSNGCLTQDILVVETIGDADRREWTSEGWTIHDPRWSPDGRLLELTLGGTDTARNVQLDTVEPEGEVLSDESAFPTIPAPESMNSYGYITGDQFVGLGNPEDATEVVTFGHDGEIGRRLGKIPGAADIFDAAVTTDGQHVLVLRGEAGAVSAAEAKETAVSIVSVGALEPRNVGGDAVAVAWFEGPPPETDEPDESAGRPDTIVAASADGPIVELDPSSGEVIRTIFDRPRLASAKAHWEDLAVSPDGKYVFYEDVHGDPERDCASSAERILRVPRSGGDPVPIASGRSPSISPDGRWLAYVPFCDQPGALAVISANSGEDSQVWTPPDGYRVSRTLGWTDDGEKVLVQYRRGAESAVGFVDINTAGRTLDPDPAAFTDDRVFYRAGAGPNGLLSYQARESGWYDFWESDGTDVISGTGEIRFEGGDGELLSWTHDAGRERCLYTVEHADGTQVGLWWRTCRGNDEPTRIAGSYTAAAW